MPGGTCLCVNQRNSVEWSPSAVNIGYLRDRDREGLDNNFSGAYIYLPIYVYIFWPHCMACGILVSWPGIEPVPCQWKRQVLTTALPGNSLMCIHLCSVILFVLVSLHCYCNLKVIRLRKKNTIKGAPTKTDYNPNHRAMSFAPIIIFLSKYSWFTILC